MRIELDDEQLAAVQRMLNEPTKAALNSSQFGTGKTVVSVEVAEQIGAKIKVIVCPLFTKYSWEKTIKDQYPDSVVKFINSKKSGQSGLMDLIKGIEGWYIVGRELFRSAKMTAIMAPISPSFDILIYDECQSWSNYKSRGFANMKKIKPKYRMALSATPAGNKFSGLYAITHWLWPKYEGHNSFWQFVADHCLTEQDFFAGITVGNEKVPGDYVANLPCYVRLEKDFGTPQEFRIEIDLSAAERKIYDQFEKYLIAWIKDNPIIAKFPIVKRVRLRQMTLGEVDVDPENDKVFFPNTMKSTKLETLVDIIKEFPEEPMLILTHSAKFAEVAAYRLIEAGYKALHWTGEVPEDIRHAMKAAFIAGELDYIVATQGSIGEGVDGLQHRARIMVWLSRDDNNMLNEQAFRRLFRRGQTKQVVSIDIVARETYDDGQLSKLIQQAIDMNASLKKDGN